MSALILLVIGALWLWLGVLNWRAVIRKRIAKPVVRGIALVAFLAIWMIGPLLDEILGARQFERLCAEMSPIEFYGPVAVGVGTFFDEQGKSKWKSRDDFALNFWEKPAWKEIFVNRDEYEVISRWPMLIAESRTVTIDRRSGRVIKVWRARYSPGGWIKRLAGWGGHAPYQCPPRDQSPNVDDWIVFRN